jgi:hypothetical protein
LFSGKRNCGLAVTFTNHAVILSEAALCGEVEGSWQFDILKRYLRHGHKELHCVSGCEDPTTRFAYSG